MIEGIVTGIAGMLSVIIYLTAYQYKKSIVRRRDALMEKMLSSPIPKMPLTLTQFYEKDITVPIESSAELIDRIERQILSRMATSPGTTKETVKQEVYRQFSELQERIMNIESRFPEEAKLEKIASINDALLSERIDQLSQQVENLEKRTLTKWDVALTVSTIIAGIVFVVGVTYAVMKFVGNAP